MSGKAFSLAAAALLFACAAAPAPRPATAWPAAPKTFASLADIERVAAQFPGSMGLQRRRLAAALEGKNAASALDAARKLAAAGAYLSPAGQKQLAALVGEEAMRPVSAMLNSNAEPVTASKVHAVIPAAHRLIEGLAWVSGSRRLYATSVVDRRLVAVVPKGAAVAVERADFASLLGAAYDPRSRKIWIASSVIDPTPKREGLFSGLLAIDPSSPGDVRRVPAPEGASLGDVAVARDGTVYASDGLKGAVYRCRPGCTALEALVPPGGLFSAQGMAVSRDQKRLYVADRRYGIAVIERRSGRISQLAAGEGTMLDGIDGLVLFGGDLIATQTAYAPQRIVRLRLSGDGARVERLDLLERAHPEWGEVTLAAVAGDRLLYVSDAQWERFGEGGMTKGQGVVPATVIRSLPLR